MLLIQEHFFYFSQIVQPVTGRPFDRGRGGAPRTAAPGESGSRATNQWRRHTVDDLQSTLDNARARDSAPENPAPPAPKILGFSVSIYRR